ncbi:MAG: C-type lectin domain-containing protein [Methylococcaceae bacterium]
MKAKNLCFILLALYANSPILLADSTQQKFNTNNHYYQRFDTAITWNEAVMKCMNLGSNVHLATITSPDENNFLAALTNQQISWIGASFTRSGDIIWINGESLMVNYMAKSINGGIHFMINNAKTWQRGGDTDLFPYICEWD